jgi:hypothetical protein
VDAAGVYDATAAVYTNWKSGQPDNINNEDCGKMIGTGEWTDKKCGLVLANHGALCNAAPTTAPTTPGI